MYRKKVGKSYSPRRIRPLQTKLPILSSKNVDVYALRSQLESLKRRYGHVRFAVTANEAAGLINYKVRASTRNSFEEMLDAIRTIKVNEFDGPKVATVLRDLADDGLIADVEFGAEGTPAIYISPPFWMHHNILGPKGKNRKYTDKERRKMLKRIIERMRDANPDELFTVDTFGNPVDPDDPNRDPSFMRVRAWWD